MTTARPYNIAERLYTVEEWLELEKKSRCPARIRLWKTYPYGR